jgi:hypothetical protein
MLPDLPVTYMKRNRLRNKGIVTKGGAQINFGDLTPYLTHGPKGCTMYSAHMGEELRSVRRGQHQGAACIQFGFAASSILEDRFL